MGKQTYGKGVIQSLKNLTETSGIAITVASYLTPNGNNIQDRGITPDIILDLTEAQDFGGSEDRWLKNAEIYLTSILDKDESADNKDNLNIDISSNDID